MKKLHQITQAQHENTLKELSDIQRRFSDYQHPPNKYAKIEGPNKSTANGKQVMSTESNSLVHKPTTQHTQPIDSTKFTNSNQFPQPSTEVVMQASAGTSSRINDPVPYNPANNTFSAQVAQMCNVVRSVATNPERNSYTMRMFNQKANTSNSALSDSEKVRLAMQQY